MASHARPSIMSTRIARVLGIRSSNASGKHADRRTKRQRTRSASKQNAIKEQQ